MGLGFVVLVWIVVLGCVGTAVAVRLALSSWRRGLAVNAPSKTRAAFAALLPFVLLAAALVWFLAYAAYSWAVRGVDPGLGDGWQVPLQHGYSFCMIDVTDRAYIMKDGCSGSPPIDEITELAEVGDSVVGISIRSGAFVFNTASGDLRLNPDRAAALAQFAPAPRLRSPQWFYQVRRWGWQDGVALALLVALELGISRLWERRVVLACGEVSALGRV